MTIWRYIWQIIWWYIWRRLERHTISNMISCICTWRAEHSLQMTDCLLNPNAQKMIDPIHPPAPPCHDKKLLSRTRSWVLFSAEYIFKSSHREYFCFYSSETCTQSSWSDLISFLQSEWYAAPVSFTHSQFLNIHKQMPIPKETISLDAARWNMYCPSWRHGSEIF